MNTKTVQAAGEFTAIMLHLGPGPHPDGSPQSVHAGGYPKRPDVAAGARRPPSPEQAGFDLDTAPASAPDDSTLNEPGMAEAEQARQKLLAAVTKHDARLAELQTGIETAAGRVRALGKRLGDLPMTLEYNPEADQLAKDWGLVLAEETQLRQQVAVIERQRQTAARRAIRPAETADFRFLKDARPGVDLPALEAAHARQAWRAIDGRQREQIAAGLKTANQLLSRDVWNVTWERYVGLQRADPAAGHGRSYHQGNSMYLTPSAGHDVVIHELGHHLEQNTRGLQARAQEFLARRTRGEAARPLNELRSGYGYDASEVAKPDRFSDPYIGKSYPSGHTEVVAMGLERMARDPLAFAQEDPDHWRFTYTITRATWRQW